MVRTATMNEADSTTQAEAAEADAPEVNEESMARAAERTLALARRANVTPVTHYAFNEQLGMHNARIKQRVLEENRPRIEALQKAGIPGLPPVHPHVFELETAATGLPLLVSRVRRAAGEPEPSQMPSFNRLMTIRDILLPTLQGAAAAGQVPEREVQHLLAGRGNRNYAMDVAEGIDLADRYPVVFGNHPTVTPALKVEGRTLSLAVLRELPPDSAPLPPKEAAERLKQARADRQLAYTFLLELDREADRLLSFLLGEEAKVRAPSLQAGRNAGRKHNPVAPAAEPTEPTAG